VAKNIVLDLFFFFSIIIIKSVAMKLSGFFEKKVNGPKMQC
jgi:hypothetical protein